MPQQANHKVSIQKGTIDDLVSVVELLKQSLAEPRLMSASRPFVFSHKTQGSDSILRERILDRCLIVANIQGRVVAAAGLDLDRSEISELVISSEVHDTELVEFLLTRTERLAVQFGLQKLSITLPASAANRFRALSYGLSQSRTGGKVPSHSAPELVLERSLRRRQTAYGRRVSALCEELGISLNYGQRHCLSLQPEARLLTTIGLDIYGREQRLTRRAAKAWQRMRQAALQDGIELQAVSAFRSVGYQVEILRRKLARGMHIEEILKVSAAPGFSEHHTGRAIDITAPGCAVLEEEFEQSAAFQWLEKHAQKFAFRLSFSRVNRHQLAYEPWHWCFIE